MILWSKSFQVVEGQQVFFHDFHAGKPASKTRVYDVNLGEQVDLEPSQTSSGSAIAEGIYAASHDEEPDLDADFSGYHDSSI